MNTYRFSFYFPNFNIKRIWDNLKLDVSRFLLLNYNFLYIIFNLEISGFSNESNDKNNKYITHQEIAVIKFIISLLKARDTTW